VTRWAVDATGSVPNTSRLRSQTIVDRYQAGGSDRKPIEEFIASCQLLFGGRDRHLIDLRCQDEVTLGQSIDGVGPDLDSDSSPSQFEVGMMILLFRDRTDLIHQIESALKVGEPKVAFEMVSIDDLPPLIETLVKSLPLFCGQWWGVASTGNAVSRV